MKPYTYVDQTLKGIQSLEDQKSLLSIDEDHMEETSNEDLKDHTQTKTIKIDKKVL